MVRGTCPRSQPSCTPRRSAPSPSSSLAVVAWLSCRRPRWRRRRRPGRPAPCRSRSTVAARDPTPTPRPPQPSPSAGAGTARPPAATRPGTPAAVAADHGPARSSRTADRRTVTVRPPWPPARPPLVRAALDARLDRLRLTLRHPGRLGRDPVRRRLDLAWPIRAGRRGGPTPGHRRHRVRGRQRLQDVHGRPDPRARRGRQAVARRPGADLSCRPSGSTRGSRSASCSTTRAGCATSSSTRAIDKALLSKPGQRLGRRPGRSATSASRTPGPGTAWHYSNTNYLLLGLIAEARRPAPRWPTSSASGSSGRSGSTTRGTSRPRQPQGPVAHGYRFTGTSRKLPADRPVGRDAGRAVHLGRHRGRRRRLDRHDRRATSPTGPRALYGGRRPRRRRSRAAMLERLRADGALQAARPVRPRRPGASRSTADPALGHSGRFLGFAGGRPLAARRADRDRRPDQPEPDRSGADPGRSCSRLALEPPAPTACACPDVP